MGDKKLFDFLFFFRTEFEPMEGKKYVGYVTVEE